jgi:hypothetical protein
MTETHLGLPLRENNLVIKFTQGSPIPVTITLPGDLAYRKCVGLRVTQITGDAKNGLASSDCIFVQSNRLSSIAHLQSVVYTAVLPLPNALNGNVIAHAPCGHNGVASAISPLLYHSAMLRWPPQTLNNFDLSLVSGATFQDLVTTDPAFEMTVNIIVYSLLEVVKD